MTIQDDILWAKACGVPVVHLPPEILEPYRERILQTLKGLGWGILEDGGFMEGLPKGIHQGFDLLGGAYPMYDGHILWETSRAFYFPGCEGGITLYRSHPYSDKHTGKKTCPEKIYWDITEEEIRARDLAFCQGDKSCL